MRAPSLQLAVASLLLLVSACAVPSSAEDASATEDSALVAHKNPMMSTPCADPGVLHEGGKYYVTCTGVDAHGAYPIFASDDLIDAADWHHVGSIFPRDGQGQVPHPWASQQFWAPEIHHVGGRYLAVYAATGPSGKMDVGIAQAMAPTGPFTADPEPIVHSGVGMIDPHIFRDPRHGKTYLYWKRDQDWQDTSIYVRELDVAHLHGQPVGFAAHSHRKAIFDFGAGWEHKLVEAPWIVYRDGWYYLFYSGGLFCDASYGVGVARSRSPVETFERISAGENAGRVLESGSHWQGPGHVSVVDGPGGDWLVYHAYPIIGGKAPHCGDPDAAQHPHDGDDHSPPREVRVDPIVWNNGLPHVHAKL